MSPDFLVAFFIVSMIKTRGKTLDSSFGRKTTTRLQLLSCLHLGSLRTRGCSDNTSVKRLNRQSPLLFSSFDLMAVLLTLPLESPPFLLSFTLFSLRVMSVGGFSVELSTSLVIRDTISRFFLAPAPSAWAHSIFAFPPLCCYSACFLSSLIFTH